MVDIESVCEPEWVEWYQMSPQVRWTESEKLWATYLSLGGSLDPEPDTQSPFFDGVVSSTEPVDGRTGLRLIRRGGV